MRAPSLFACQPRVAGLTPQRSHSQSAARLCRACGRSRSRCRSRYVRFLDRQCPRRPSPCRRAARSTNLLRDHAPDRAKRSARRRSPVRSARHCRNVRHPGGKVLKCDVVDLAPELIAVVGLSRWPQGRDRRCLLGPWRGLWLRLFQDQIVKPGRCGGEVKEVQRLGNAILPGHILALPSPRQTDGATIT